MKTGLVTACTPVARTDLAELQERIVNCDRCPRLVKWCREVAITKKKEYREEAYWGKPVPSFGDPNAWLLIVGLAPGAHGANRTGRMFTGDRSGDWLYRVLHRAGFANQPTSKTANDGLKLQGAYITAAVHCAPPDNKPATLERDSCLPYLGNELRLLTHIRVIVALGGFAWESTHRALLLKGYTASKKMKFGHGVTCKIGRYTLVGSYHPSQQNTFTGRLTEAMLDQVFIKARQQIF